MHYRVRMIVCAFCFGLVLHALLVGNARAYTYVYDKDAFLSAIGEEMEDYGSLVGTSLSSVPTLPFETELEASGWGTGTYVTDSGYNYLAGTNYWISFYESVGAFGFENVADDSMNTTVYLYDSAFTLQLDEQLLQDASFFGVIMEDGDTPIGNIQIYKSGQAFNVGTLYAGAVDRRSADPVPIPGAVWLLGSGLVGLLGLRRKQ